MPKTCRGTSSNAITTSPSKPITRKKTTPLFAKHQPLQPDMVTTTIRATTAIANATVGGSTGDTGGTAGGAGAPGGSGGGPPAGPVSAAAAASLPNVALTPSLAVQGYLDYANLSHIKLYKTAMYPFTQEFDINQEGLKLFLENFKQQAFVSNWWPTLTIQKNGQQLNLIDNYDLFTMEEVTNHALTFVGQPNRHAQNLVQILECLSATLTERRQQKVALKVDQYTITPLGGHLVAEGLCYFKVIVQLAYLDMCATTTTI